MYDNILPSRYSFNQAITSLYAQTFRFLAKYSSKKLFSGINVTKDTNFGKYHRQLHWTDVKIQPKYLAMNIRTTVRKAVIDVDKICGVVVINATQMLLNSLSRRRWKEENELSKCTLDHLSPLIEQNTAKYWEEIDEYY